MSSLQGSEPRALREPLDLTTHLPPLSCEMRVTRRQEAAKCSRQPLGLLLCAAILLLSAGNASGFIPAPLLECSLAAMACTTKAPLKPILFLGGFHFRNQQAWFRRFRKARAAKAASGDQEPDPGLREKAIQDLDKFISIALPAFVQFMAEPLASLVDTVYIGKLGPAALGGVGVAISAQYSVSKLYNDPLLRTSISKVASGAGKALAQGTSDSDGRRKELSDSVSSALVLALLVGLLQALVYSVACDPIVRAMGVGPTSEMFPHAVSYLRVRSLGTPGATVWLVVQGIYRGLGDTATPLKWALAFTALNAVLDPLFIFTLGMGCSGAAAGTAVAQNVALVPLVLRLHEKVGLKVDAEGLKSTIGSYAASGGYMLVRTVAKILTYTVCAREAALLGTVAAAAYSITFQIGTATTQICESFAVAAQSLLARELEGTDARVKKHAIVHIISRAVSAGGAVAVVLSLATWTNQRSVLGGLTSNPAVLAAATGIMPIVLLTQVSKGLAYPVNGVVMGGSDWGFLTLSMWFCNILCCSLVMACKPTQTIGTIWVGLAVFMTAQCITGLARVASGGGVWKAIKA